MKPLGLPFQEGNVPFLMSWGSEFIVAKDAQAMPGKAYDVV